MKKTIKLNILALFTLLCFSCSSNSDNLRVTETLPQKEFSTSFESLNDFDAFYKTPQDHLGTSFHELTDTKSHSGKYSHRAWISGANPSSTTANNNHRGYPTIQFQKTTEGTFKTPCYITLWVWLDMELNNNSDGENDWFSFATFTDDESDNWNRTVLVNLSADGFVHLQHTTNQGEQKYIYQTTDLSFPQKEWVELKIYLDFRNNAYAKVWQNGQLVSHAPIGNISNKLAQAHFGMYCSPQLSSGEVYNDDLTIKEVQKE